MQRVGGGIWANTCIIIEIAFTDYSMTNIQNVHLIKILDSVPAYTVRCPHQIIGFSGEIFDFEILQIGFCEDYLENKMGESYLR